MRDGVLSMKKEKQSEKKKPSDIEKTYNVWRKQKLLMQMVE